MTTPRPRLLWLFLLAALPLSMPALLLPTGWLSADAEVLCWRTGIGFNLVMFGVALWDLWRSVGLSGLEVVREVPPVMSVGARNSISVWLTNRGSSAVDVEIEDTVPQPSLLDDLPLALRVEPQSSVEGHYHLVPQRRGAHEFGEIYLRTKSRLGLWSFLETRGQPQPVKVFPDIQSVSRMELLLRNNRLTELGIRRSLLRERGSEFERLREYRRGDEPRAIDWKATSRQRQLISREYTIEKNQTVIVVVDSGSSMCNEDSGIRHFDRALNSAMVFSYLALRQGDSVGLMVGSNRLERWIRPMHGSNAIQGLIRASYDVEASHFATDYGLIADQIRQRVRKRSLIMLLTHAMDELHLESALKPLLGLTPPHLVLVACLRNVPLDERGRATPRSAVEAVQIGAANEFLLQQSRGISQLNAAGIRTLDVLPKELTGELVGQYLEIKARHLL